MDTNVHYCLHAHNALLSSEARYTNASALLRNHKTNRKPKMPRVPNLLEQFVMWFLLSCRFVQPN
ncbi:hypothetical protein DDO10_09020 [Vibrio cholerae]|nr:hypothetical protein [Vibrio cholerae]